MSYDELPCSDLLCRHACMHCSSLQEVELPLMRLCDLILVQLRRSMLLQGGFITVKHSRARSLQVAKFAEHFRVQEVGHDGYPAQVQPREAAKQIPQV